MARGRMFANSFSTSKRRAQLLARAGDLAEYAQSLYPMLVSHADDYGRLEGDVVTVRSKVDPLTRRSDDDVERALQFLDDVRLITWYEAGGERIIQIEKFWEHQPGLKVRSASSFPAPEAAPSYGTLSASERDVEAFIADELLSGALRIGDLTVTTVDRQVRIGNSYIDLLARTVETVPAVIEVKRQRVSNAACQQVTTYAALVVGAVPIVIGHGLAANLDLTASPALIATYDDTMRIQTRASFPVNGRQITLTHVISCQSQLKGTELKGTEDNGTEGGTERKEEPNSTEGNKGHPASDVQTVAGLLIGELGARGYARAVLMAELDQRCERLRLTRDPATLHAALDRALAKAQKAAS